MIRAKSAPPVSQVWLTAPLYAIERKNKKKERTHRTPLFNNEKNYSVSSPAKAASAASRAATKRS